MFLLNDIVTLSAIDGSNQELRGAREVGAFSFRSLGHLDKIQANLLNANLHGGTSSAFHLHTVFPRHVLQRPLLVKQFVVLVHLKDHLAAGGLEVHNAGAFWAEHQCRVKSEGLKSYHRVLYNKKALVCGSFW